MRVSRIMLVSCLMLRFWVPSCQSVLILNRAYLWLAGGSVFQVGLVGCNDALPRVSDYLE